MKRSLLTLLLLAAQAALAADPALTIYNQNFAVVREIVALDLKAGVSTAKFGDATAQVEADSVILRDPTGKSKFSILEQSYRNDPVSQSLLLSLFEGKTIKFLAKEANKPDRVVEGKVIRSGYWSGYSPGSQGPAPDPIVEVDGELQFSLPGEPHFPALGDDTILKPTLSWKIESGTAAKVEAELSYITGGLSWEASYNLVAPEKGDSLDLIGWITMRNQSGKLFSNAKVMLLAGDVRKEQAPQIPQMVGVAPSEVKVVVNEQTFDEYHLYTLANPATLRDHETKQVEFTRAQGIKSERSYIYDGLEDAQPVVGIDTSSLNREPDYGTRANKKVWVIQEFKNSEANKLGIALPMGRIRFYRQDGEKLQFVGENKIEHTPRDETLRLYTGDSFDLVGERKRTNIKIDEANHKMDESFEIKVRNHKKEPVEIRVKEHLYRSVNWKVAENTSPYTKTDSQTMEFRVKLKPDEKRVITYDVHYTW